MSDSLRPHELFLDRLLCSSDSPGKNTGVGCCALLQGIILMQRFLLHYRQILCHLSHQGSPIFEDIFKYTSINNPYLFISWILQVSTFSLLFFFLNYVFFFFSIVYSIALQLQWSESAVVVQSHSRVWLFATPWTAACRIPCLSLSPGTCSNSCPLSQWCHPTILSSVVPFFSCLQSFPASESFPMSLFFAAGGQILEFQL